METVSRACTRMGILPILLISYIVETMSPGKVDELSNFSCTTCGSTTYCRSLTLAGRYEDIECYKYSQMQLARENPAEGQFLTHILKICSFDLPKVQNKSRYTINSNGMQTSVTINPCNRSLIFTNGGHYQVDGSWNCQGGSYPYLCEKPYNTGQPGNSIHYFFVEEKEYTFRACVNRCKYELQLSGTSFITYPTLLLPEKFINGLLNRKSYWLAWYQKDGQCGMIGVPGKSFIPYFIHNCSLGASCICESPINRTSTVSRTTTTQLYSIPTSVPGPVSSPGVTSTPIAQHQPSTTSAQSPTISEQSSTTSEQSSTSSEQASTTSEQASTTSEQTSTSSEQSTTTSEQSSTTSAPSPTISEQSSTSPAKSTANPQGKASGSTVGNYTLPGAGSYVGNSLVSLQNSQYDWIHVNFSDKVFKLTARDVGFCEARKTCSTIGGHLWSPKKVNIPILVWSLRLAPKAPIMFWINTRGKPCKPHSVPEKANVLSIGRHMHEIREEYSSKRHKGICERSKHSVTQSTTPKSKNGTTTCSPPTDWVEHGKSQFYVNRNQSSFQQADNFCRRRLNATLLFYTNAIQYLDLSDDLSLTSGRFWIGVLSSNSSSPKCLQLNVNKGNSVLEKVNCHTRSSSICSRSANISDVLNDPKFVKLLEELRIDKTSTQKSQRKLKSVFEERQTAKAVGGIGIAVFVTVFTLIALMDLSRLRHTCRQRTKLKVIHFKHPSDVNKRGRSMSECTC